MTRPDWHALSAQHGPQRSPVKERELATPLPPSVCGRCGAGMKVPALVTRAAVLCRDCAAGEPVAEPPLVCGKRIEQLVWEATRRYERLKHGRDLLAGANGPWDSRLVPLSWPRRYTAERLDRAVAAAYRRFWRRKRIWLTQ